MAFCTNLTWSRCLQTQVYGAMPCLVERRALLVIHGKPRFNHVRWFDDAHALCISGHFTPSPVLQALAVPTKPISSKMPPRT